MLPAIRICWRRLTRSGRGVLLRIAAIAAMLSMVASLGDAVSRTGRAADQRSSPPLYEWKMDVLQSRRPQKH